MEDILSKTADTLDKIKDALVKDFSSFGTVIGGGTKEKPTIKPTTSTSQDVRDASSGGSWFGFSEKEEDSKEEISFSKCGQWSISEVKESGR